MPAVTVDDLTTLRRIAVPEGGTGLDRPVVSVTMGPRGIEGEGFSGAPGIRRRRRRPLDPFIHID